MIDFNRKKVLVINVYVTYVAGIVYWVSSGNIGWLRAIVIGPIDHVELHGRVHVLHVGRGGGSEGQESDEGELHVADALVLAEDDQELMPSSEKLVP